MISKIIRSIRKNGLYMAFWYKWSIILSYLHFDKKLITPHRDTWYKNKVLSWSFSKNVQFVFSRCRIVFSISGLCTYRVADVYGLVAGFF